MSVKQTVCWSSVAVENNASNMGRISHSGIAHCVVRDETRGEMDMT